MGFSCGIIGLPNVGKSTIFNALTAIGVPAAPFPFCTIEPNVGKAPVPDHRLDRLASLVKPQKVTPTSMEFVDIAGLVRGASKGEGLGNQFLGHIRSVQAIAHIVRCFEDPNVAHVSASIDPVDDMRTVNLELLLADLDTVEKRLDKQQRLAKIGNKELKTAVSYLELMRDHLQKGLSARGAQTSLLEQPAIVELGLLSAKPMLYVLNVAEDDLEGKSRLAALARQEAEQEHVLVVPLSGKIEAELMSLPPDDQEEYRKELGIQTKGLEQLINAGYQLLDLITFYTTVGVELRAWTIPSGMCAQAAAGKIHTDMERGFIKADVISFTEFERLGSETKVRESGLLRSEGRDYIVQDGDIIRFKFNV